MSKKTATVKTEPSLSPTASIILSAATDLAGFAAWTLVAIFSPWQVTVVLGAPIVLAVAIVMIRSNDGLSEAFGWLRSITGRDAQ